MAVHQWVQLYGEFDSASAPAELVFKGRPHEYVSMGQDGKEPSSTTEVGPLFGVALTPIRMAEGRVAATFTFSDAAPRTTGEVVLAHDVNTKYQLTAGINTIADSMFNIREWVTVSPAQAAASGQSASPQPFWRSLDVSGNPANLAIGRPYRIEAWLVGSRVWLIVDGVPVAAATLGQPPLYPRSVGVWCRSLKDVVVSSFEVQTQRPRAFVVMKFAQPFFDVYGEVIKSVCNEFGLDAFHGGEMYGPGIIIRDIIDQISKSQVVIADITESNANVYFEVGYALAQNKPLILLAKSGTELPFDVSGFRVLFYEDTIGGRTRLQEGLRNHLHVLRGQA